MSKNINIEIFTLGEFRIVVDGRDITVNFKSSKKKLLLLEYLIINADKAVSVSNLVDVLWGDNKDMNIESTLKTLISRLRKDLSEYGLSNAIATKRGAYMWSDALRSRIDIFILRDLAKELEQVAVLSNETREKFEEVLSLYKGDLYSAAGAVKPLSNEVNFYRTLYIKTVRRYIKLLGEHMEYTDMMRVCKSALEIDKVDMDFNIGLMTALMKSGKSNEAMRLYRTLSTVNIASSPKHAGELRNFYRELLTVEKNSEKNIENIHQELTDQNTQKGAFVCEYTIFKDVYSLFSRNFNRIGSSLFLGVVSLNTAYDTVLSPFEIDRSMQNLLEILKNNFRGSDVISRYSLRQFALLMPEVSSIDVGRAVIERAKKMFYTNSDNIAFNVEYKLMQLFERD